MNRILSLTLICWLMTGLPGYGSEKKLPVIDGKIAVASVNDNTITLEEFNRAIAQAHAKNPKGKKAGRIDYSAIMDRMINTRLIGIEGRNMGLDELPEVKHDLDAYSRETLMTLLMVRQVKDIKADPEEVEKVYQELVKEWKITTVSFENEDAAKKFSQELQAGDNFEETVKRARSEGLARGVDEGRYLKDQDLLPPVARLVSKMEVGSVSPVVALGRRVFIVFRLEGMRVPEEENQQARKEAKQLALNQKKTEVARAYYQDLRERWVKVNEELLAALDYESPEPGFDQLLRDSRVIAEINEGKPITVGDLGDALKGKFYHGVERAIEKKKINKRKKEMLESMIEKKILLKEALKQNIDKTEEYIDRVRQYELSLIFGTFVNKVIIPDIKLDIKELKSYYEDNREDYTLPQMVRIKSIAFAEKSKAVNALEKLRQGTDFNWLSSTAEDQVDNNGPGVLKFRGNLLTVSSLPEAMRQVLSQVRPGDFRLYESPEGLYYVLYVYHVVPSELQPFDKVKREVAKKVFDDKVKKAIEDYAEKLKEHYPVKIYAKDLQ